ncbi:MAG: 2,3,4,5-tetrahydropyridine-2,6-dicarboxylate N-succinyltransferase [Deltaproteobacteria bacterium]|nr:2,3,4,5-tetrahydropyridine-2,6-dicarboxylate N-succinyltransferase [Deltaproteobacteria bacterium]
MSVLDSLAPFLDLDAAAPFSQKTAALSAFEEFLSALEKGDIRCASRGETGQWSVEGRVKKGILLGFRLGDLVSMGDESLSFVDKATYPIRHFTVDDRVRVVPGGSSVRRGAYIAPTVTIMPPAYLNVGAFVDEGTMVDSHALVGSCAQIGKGVHLSAAAQIGGVLEPIGALPVVIEDDVMVGGNVGVYEGTLVRQRAILGAGVVLTASTRVYDLVHERVIAANLEAGEVLEIPAGAVVIPGSRPAKGAFSKENGLQISTPLIVKYRDEKTDARTALEAALR